MSKIRVYEIAKQLNISSKELIKILADFGIEVHSHMSSLDDEEAQLIIDYYTTDDSKDANDIKSKDKNKKVNINDSKAEFGEELNKEDIKIDKKTKVNQKEDKKEILEDSEEDSIKIIKIPNKITV
ncbi:MAG TPA: translation initiation factor IF-2 N-terminal domain-containing protein, partial [Defluviitaleaceae bacterium]|nr:translation initiation factor IF-2 N-terminal domain-containing protein [Defluviitaleaceae bacterium]